MSLASSSPACSRRPAGAGCAQSARLPLLVPLLLLLLLLTPSWHQVEAGPINAVVARELRCTCLHTSPRVHPRMIKRLQVTPAGPHCSKVEVIAFLKNQNTVCLDPEAPWMKKVLEKMLDSSEIRKTSDHPSGTTF